ncbi:MAG: sulfatase [Chthoniobacteraceae bacterium]
MSLRALLLVFTIVAGGFAAERPNILLILADNWSSPHAGVLGDKTVRTPVFDRLASEGALFRNAFCPVPSCSPTRSCLLTGRVAHQLEDAASLWSGFPKKFTVFTEALRTAGYETGYCAKGWSPGRPEGEMNPVGTEWPRVRAKGKATTPRELDEQMIRGFGEFMEERDKRRPFFFWLGITLPARHTWHAGEAARRGLRAETVQVPGNMPDVPEVRTALLEYYASVERLDALAGKALALLGAQGVSDSTLVVYTGDNGWQMPRGLANCYDTGTHVPLAIRWPGVVQPRQVFDQFISLTDFAPTFLDVGGRLIPQVMTGRSFAPLLRGEHDPAPRDAVFLERERHANVRAGNLSYPMRAIRTRDHLYLRNLRPDRWPAGDPDVWFAVGPYGDVDQSLAKDYILAHRDEPAVRRFYELNFAKRPAEELYDLRADPEQLVNVAGKPEHRAAKDALRARLDQWMRDTDDPRVDPAYDRWDEYPYYGGSVKK